MMHWFHRMAGRTRRLAKYAAGEMTETEHGRMRARLAACPVCRQEVEAYRQLSAALRVSPRLTLTSGEAAAFWPSVEGRIRRGEGPATHPARPSLRELYWDHPRLSLVSAAAAIVLVLGLTLGPMVGRGPDTHGSNGAEVVSVEAGENTSVMLFQAPGSTLKVIWVFAAPSS
jgi:anti-sigma factor RsiW